MGLRAWASRTLKWDKTDKLKRSIEQFSHDVTGGNRGVSKDIRDFKIQRRGRQREGKKKGLISKTTTSHFLYISFPFLHD